MYKYITERERDTQRETERQRDRDTETQRGHREDTDTDIYTCIMYLFFIKTSLLYIYLSVKYS